MTNPSSTDDSPVPDAADDDAGNPACVIVFNASDPSGAGGLAADITAVASVGAHALPVVTGAYARDSAEVFDHFSFDEDVIAEQARAILEDVPVQVFKVGFVGSPEAISTIAEIAADYAEVPLIAYMPDLSWWTEGQIDLYLDAFRELMLPQTTVLVGNHSTLWRWLLPDWSSDKSPTARDIAKAASDMGVPYTLVTGIPMPDQFIDNVLATPQAVLGSEKFERFEAIFLRRRRHPVGGARRPGGQRNRPGSRIHRGPGLPRSLPGRGLSPRHGQRRARPPVLGPARRRNRRTHRGRSEGPAGLRHARP